MSGIRNLTADLLERRAKLAKLRKEIDAEIVAIDNGLRMAGVLRLRGRPRKAPAYTDLEAREAHARHQAGERTPEVIEGHRQYQRENTRQRRSETA